MVDTWNFPVETKPQGTMALQVKRAQFGDGYVQKAAYGLNAKTETWIVTVDNTETVVSQARAFLENCGGYLPFYWTPPGATAPRMYTCETWTENPNLADQNRLTATFERYYAP